MSDRIGTIVVEVHIPVDEDFGRALNEAAIQTERAVQDCGFTYHIAIVRGGAPDSLEGVAPDSFLGNVISALNQKTGN